LILLVYLDPAAAVAKLVPLDLEGDFWITGKADPIVGREHRDPRIAIDRIDVVRVEGERLRRQFLR
jgi:hypothetical protein